MVGVAGRSGGARANSGGARPGAGRKPKVVSEKSANKRGASRASVETKLEPQAHGGALKREKSVPVELPERDMLTLLKDIALGRVDASAGQIRAAIAAVQYTHVKRADGGKKEEQQDAAKKVASRFSASAPPKLVAANGKKV